LPFAIELLERREEKQRSVSPNLALTACAAPTATDGRFDILLFMTHEPGSALMNFYSEHYQAHNRARLEHLASLGLRLQHRTVLELGSGPGDHTLFYLQRGCRVSAIDGRSECLEALNRRFPQVAAHCMDLNSGSGIDALGPFEVAHCYGILYHLERPESLIAALGRVCTDIAVVETCVSLADNAAVTFTPESVSDFTQSLTGTGCRPTRQWLFQELKRWFPHVYVTATQPDHPEFPLDWTADLTHNSLVRCVFVASRAPLRSSHLLSALPSRQRRFVGEDAEQVVRGLAPALKILDLGALFVGTGAEPYARLLSGGQASIVGFEAISEACVELNQRFAPDRQFLPYAIANGRRRNFYRCNQIMTSSLYEPDQDVMGRYENLSELCQVESVYEVDTWRLDDVEVAQDADFLKIDVQGAELDVLKHGVQTLRSVVAIQTEVEFVPIYKFQPLFADVDKFLRSQEFQFFRFINADGRALKSDITALAHTQVLWADAVYIKTSEQWTTLSDGALAKLALILHVLYDAFDHTAELLRIFDERHCTGYRMRYLEKLGC
jgi:FkbM family methyltransferase